MRSVIGNTLDKLHHPRSDTYSAVLLNKQYGVWTRERTIRACTDPIRASKYTQPPSTPCAPATYIIISGRSFREHS